MAQKFINITPDILIEWNYSTGEVSETYELLTNLKSGKKSFLSTSNKNDMAHTLFNVDPVINKFTKVDTQAYNFLQVQNYFTSPIQYDTVKIHFPTNYDFDNYIGFIISIYAYDFNNNKTYYFSDFFFDKTDLYSEKSMNMEIPFMYGEKEWNKNITLSIPSIEEISNQRQVTRSRNIPTPFTINANMTELGLSQTAPIRIDFSFLTGKETILGNTYYYIGDILQKSIPKVPEYQSLGVTVRESPDWDFFEIYGTYKNSNEGLDNFIYELESKGLHVRIDYTVTLYEENIQSGYPITYSVTENFAQKIEFRPVFKYSNTTAAIDVQMDVVNLADYSRIVRRATLGLTSNLFKYGKKLAKFDVSNVYKPKIYNFKQGSPTNMSTGVENTSYVVTKVPYPVLTETSKILVNSSNSFNTPNGEFKSTGLLNIVLSPYDNIIKFQLFEQKKDAENPEPFKINSIINNGKILLTFKSDTEILEKDILYETGDNDFDNGVVVFKINENDMTILKRMSKDKKDNFYLVLQGYKTKTQLYSGKFKLFEDLKFIDYAGATWRPYVAITPSTGTTQSGGETVTPNDTVTPTKKVIVGPKHYTKTPVIDKAIKDSNPREESNLPDVQPPVMTVEQTEAEKFKQAYDLKVVQYANYLLIVKSQSEIVQFFAVVDDISNGKSQYGIGPNNIYYYNPETSIIILQGVKKNNDFITTPTILNQKIKEIYELKIDLGVDESTFKGYSIQNFYQPEVISGQGKGNNMIQAGQGKEITVDFKIVIPGRDNGITSINFDMNTKVDLIDLSTGSDNRTYEWSIQDKSTTIPGIGHPFVTLSTNKLCSNLDLDASPLVDYAGPTSFTFKLKVTDGSITKEILKNLAYSGSNLT